MSFGRRRGVSFGFVELGVGLDVGGWVSTRGPYGDFVRGVRCGFRC